ncbi:MAG: hypothetical protein J0M07_11550 [Anaerolineae bacterium]|nr:hypothetical protein [Anaerolineae bacterium]
MTHLSEMLDRLPILYRDGALVADTLRVPSLGLDILDEDGIEVQRAHWFDSALNLQEVARLAAVLDIPLESWQNLAEYRAWVHALRDAMLQYGAVTVEAIENFVRQYARLYQASANILAIPQLERWQAAPSTVDPALIENVPVRRFQRIPDLGGVEPLWQFSVENKGLDPAYLDVLMVGLFSGPEYVPTLINITTGEALLFLGQVPPGQRLWLDGQPDGSVRAHLERTDVSASLRSVTGVIPGTPWDNAQVQTPAKAITLARGRNDLWFLPLAHYDALGLDRFLLALADLALQQGRYDAATFDHALFYQDPAVNLNVSWVETQPATFRVALPGGALRTDAGRTATGVASREELQTSLDVAVNKLRAVGVASSVEIEPFREVQPMTDYLSAVLPITVREAASMGADQLPDAGGVFGVTPFDESTFR